MGNASALAGLLLLFGAASTSPASAQATAEGAYAKLSPGNAKVARALYEAQASNTTPAAATAATTSQAPKVLTIDQIAAMKNGQGWGQVFQSMRALGLVAEKSLGQVVSRYQQRVNGKGAAVKTAANTAPKQDVAVSASYDDNRYDAESFAK